MPPPLGQLRIADKGTSGAVAKIRHWPQIRAGHRVILFGFFFLPVSTAGKLMEIGTASEMDAVLLPERAAAPPAVLERPAPRDRPVPPGL